jgi:hypothetical protein
LWESGQYTIKRGDNKTGADVPKHMSDVFHCYHAGVYIAQGDNLETAKMRCKKHLEAQ